LTDFALEPRISTTEDRARIRLGAQMLVLRRAS
jgi:hypothetical protein